MSITQKIAKKICRILVRRLSWYSVDLFGFVFFDFLFAIFHFVLMCLWMESSIAFSSSSIVTGFMR